MSDDLLRGKLIDPDDMSGDNAIRVADLRVYGKQECFGCEESFVGRVDAVEFMNDAVKGFSSTNGVLIAGELLHRYPYTQSGHIFRPIWRNCKKH